ncbi:MAG TPA: GxxExxY protein [Verrucomicrobiae bacterium]|nr:GxxExxY protein [Verrucomicrobiae bacterium]
MDTDKKNSFDRDALNALSGNVIGAVYEVANGLGAGFPEKVYERALMREFALRGIRALLACQIQRARVEIRRVVLTSDPR